MCPNFIPKTTYTHCAICGEEICIGDEYIKNEDDEYAHWECVNNARDLAGWLGYKIEIMEDEFEMI